MSFASLSETQKDQYRRELERLGCREHQGLVAPRGGKGPIYLSSDPAESAILPHFLRIDDLDQLKALGGVPDQSFADGWEEPAISLDGPFRLDRNVASTDELTVEEMRHLVDAGRAYVLGPSHKAAVYKESFERLLMPLAVAAFAAEDVVVTADKPLVFKGPNPVVASFGKITVEPGGQIRMETSVKLTAQKIEVKAGDDKDKTVTSVGQTPGASAAGGAGGIGPEGQPGKPGKDGKNSCEVAASRGDKGGVGTPGGPGGPGGNGGPANDVQATFDTIEGDLKVLTSGGSGGKAGDGGKGGTGGPGGPGGAASGKCGAGPQGAGGDGGAGGVGGNGGDGGKGAVIYVTYKVLKGSVKVETPQGIGGAPGAGGPPGDPGKGSTAGGAGAPGAPGQAGKPGEKGQVIVKQV